MTNESELTAEIRKRCEFDLYSLGIEELVNKTFPMSFHTKEIGEATYIARRTALNQYGQLMPKIEALLEVVEMQKKALEFYSLESSYNVVNEGRNYNDKYVVYEIDGDTYDDKEMGTMARTTLAESDAKLRTVLK